MHAILVPGAFGERGAEGKIEAIRFARERNIPFWVSASGQRPASKVCAIRSASRAPPRPSWMTEEPVVGIIENG